MSEEKMKIESKWVYYERAADYRAAAWSALQNIKEDSAEAVRSAVANHTAAVEAFRS